MNTETIYEYLERIANLLRTDTRKAGISKGLQPVQLEALHYLKNCNRYSNTPAAVADFLGLTKGTVSQTLGVLETAGLIEKQPDSRDRRVVHLRLTESGASVIADSMPPKVLQEAMNLTSATEQDILLNSLAQVLRALQKANRLRTFGVCKTCRHHRVEADDRHRCGLTGEILLDQDIDKICREHEPPPETGSTS
ncbi:MAG: MarR family winged helix-turn-helix transcriptional regulator [Methylococcaceae bacterium]|nr:MarR family winged helix-turn-helix transcriptional regulator [Methylococcaceae bacterium]